MGFKNNIHKEERMERTARSRLGIDERGRRYPEVAASSGCHGGEGNGKGMNGWKAMKVEPLLCWKEPLEQPGRVCTVPR